MNSTRVEVLDARTHIQAWLRTLVSIITTPVIKTSIVFTATILMPLLRLPAMGVITIQSRRRLTNAVIRIVSGLLVTRNG